SCWTPNSSRVNDACSIIGQYDLLPTMIETTSFVLSYTSLVHQPFVKPKIFDINDVDFSKMRMARIYQEIDLACCYYRRYLKYAVSIICDKLVTKKLRRSSIRKIAPVRRQTIFCQHLDRDLIRHVDRNHYIVLRDCPICHMNEKLRHG